MMVHSFIHSTVIMAHFRHRAAGIFLEVFFILEIIDRFVRSGTNNSFGLIYGIAANRIDSRTNRVFRLTRIAD